MTLKELKELIGKKRSTMTLKEHIKLAKWLVKARKDLMSISCFTPKGIRRNKSETLRIWKIVDLIDKAKCLMDGIYCDLVDKETLDKLGFIYYGGK